MRFSSTRGGENHVQSSSAIVSSIACDGGLFVPDDIPQINEKDLLAMQEMDYDSIAYFILKKFFTDFDGDVLKQCIESAYDKSFDISGVAPLKKLADKLHILELFHGPTCAFKDVALQLLPHLLVNAKKNIDNNSHTLILTATSGDTGKAALDGFGGVKDTSIMVYYPQNGVSEIQKLQMVTQLESNTCVVEVKGNFDDTQTGVKTIFSDKEFAQSLGEKNIELASANSINFGRLAPQIVYYFAAYTQLLKAQDIQIGDRINFIVPTGNFGNILAGWYAKSMGLPIGKLVCASNSNNILYDFFTNGIYNIKRKFYKTSSPSMDILISSNLERLLYEVSGHDHELISDFMYQLKTTGEYKVPLELLTALQEIISVSWTDDVGTKDTIKAVWDKYDYLLDTHTAVAFESFLHMDNNETNIIVSTASPYKFPLSVIAAIDSECNIDLSPDMLTRRLLELTKVNMPEPLYDMEKKSIVHKSVCEKQDMIVEISKFIDRMK